MITRLSDFLIRAGAAMKNCYPIGAVLTTKAKATNKELLDSGKTSYTTTEILNVPIGEKMDLPAFFGQQTPEHFILPGTEIVIRKISNDNLRYTLEGRFISTFHDRNGNHKIDTVIEIDKDVIHEMFERPSTKSIAA